jgi:glycosyltransferase involved in cell wall biosynthesis
LAVRSRFHGVGRYVINLVAALTRVDQQSEFLVLATSKTRSFFEGFANVEVMGFDGAAPIRVVWEHTVLPLRLRQWGVDVFFGPAHTVPLIRTTRQVVAVLDMSWFRTGVHHTFVKRLYFRRMIPLSVKRADAVITISEATKRDVADIVNVDAKPIVSTPLGLDEAFKRSSADEIAAVRVRYGLVESPYVISVGVFEPRKNQEGLIRAFARLVHRSAEFDHTLVLAGNVGFGWQNSHVWNLVEELGVGDRVKVLDALPDAELRSVLSGADVFVYPSFYEGFGLPVLEAMACGVPVVTSGVSSMPEVAGDAARYVNPADHVAIAEALECVLRDSDLRAQMVAEGMRRSRTFTWDDCARRTLAVFHEAAKV